MKKYGKDFHWALTGTFKKKLDQQAQIQNDLGVSSTIALVLVLLYLAFHLETCIVFTGSFVISFRILENW